jgi:hypothetical protein
MDRAEREVGRVLDLAVITSRGSEVVVRVVDGRPVIVPPASQAGHASKAGTVATRARRSHPERRSVKNRRRFSLVRRARCCRAFQSPPAESTTSARW